VDDVKLTCEDLEPLYQDYLDGYLLSSQREIVEAHLRTCASCVELLTGLGRLDDRLARLEPVEAPGRLTNFILASLPATTYRPPFAWQFAQFAALPALIALLAAGIFFKGDLFTFKGGRAGTREVDVVFVAPGAASVAVVGDFNGWDPRRNPMVRGAEREAWRTRLVLPPGVYQYNFVVDGTVWEKDPQAKNYLADGFGGQNSVIVVDG
jgi:anti-sigma factor RsiW